MASLASSSVPSQEGRDPGLPMTECLVGPLRDGGVVLPVAEEGVSCGVPGQAEGRPQYPSVANLTIACDAASSAAAQGFAGQGLEGGLEVPTETGFVAVVELQILVVGLDDQEGRGVVLEAFRGVQVACLEILEVPFVGLLELGHRANLPQDPQH